MTLELHGGPGAVLVTCQFLMWEHHYAGSWWTGRGQLGGKLSSLIAFLLNAIEPVSFFPRPLAASLLGCLGFVGFLKIPDL